MFRSMMAAVAALGLMALPTLAAPLTEVELQEKVDTVREEAGLVALGAVVVDADGEVLGLAVSGERRKGSGDAVQPGDAWHIGSNTKMLTALLYGRLVEQGKAEWGDTLPELFPDLAEDMSPAWQDVTIEQLFSHRSGLAANPATTWFLTHRDSKEPVEAQRTELAQKYLSKAPDGKVGTFQYSNLGYMIAGAAIDRIAERQGYENYEALFLSTLVPEGEGWGFGPPQEGVEGHARNLFGQWKSKGKGSAADNPAALGPAGTLHVPLVPHAVFLSRFLTPGPTEEKLMTPYPDADSDYAFGWGMIPPGKLGPVLGHSGSNTMWLSTVHLLPEQGLVIIVNTNSFSQKAASALNSFSAELAASYASEESD
ncbi:serine hydrolase domain-containing protein [Hyphomonas pacifica]|uniref:Beta-lactamase-related domain-containing protein n=2 Tax=Hyphomonas pacifica TaxID=1280941 RepID=A0A062U0W7_9PROT|nr:serine hydrolase domain-containing protein [Hyphomonas pacifica]KCZ48399.1 hypothetical protein HY2_04120 [Hyphomonas pacifica]RAN31711.1 hypothetical protein HY3_03815 [Hyphomonas pacifica]